MCGWFAINLDCKESETTVGSEIVCKHAGPFATLNGEHIGC